MNKVKFFSVFSLLLNLGALLLILILSENIFVALPLIVVLLAFCIACHAEIKIIVFLSLTLIYFSSLFYFFLGLMGVIFNGIPDGAPELSTYIIGYSTMVYSILNPIVLTYVVLNKKQKVL